ncbi:HAMP domain-containing sensor histidine kinase [Amycolatopsis sp. NPDC006125]|uniref:sensor histidine kinase n=1 Tax=Amycolatopsis sp. NPDC006125 TaxID=3156730 RepID=UPI0033AE468B
MTARLSARSRLTLVYTALVLVAGAVLTVVTYLLTRRRAVLVQITGSGPPPLDVEVLAREVREDTLATLLGQGWIALAAVTAVAALVAWLVAGRVLRPIRTISATARRLSAENLSHRVPVRPPHDELAALAETINGMLDRIQRGMADRDRALESRRLFSANAAHELRTPLTTIRTAVDVTLDGEPTRAELLTMAADVRDAAENSRRTLDGLLALARSQAGAGDRRRLDLAALAAESLAGVASGLSAQDIEVERDLHPAWLCGEPVLLERMVANLIGNAVRHNHPGGSLAVSTRAGADGVVLRVVNTGAVVPAQRVERLLEPFVRGENSRGGAGLGLSIVRAVVLAHDGTLTAAANPGGGLDVTVRLPAA